MRGAQSYIYIYMSVNSDDGRAQSLDYNLGQRMIPCKYIENWNLIWVFTNDGW